MNRGADDFIAKPFDQSVLMAKLQALLRRTYDFAGGTTVLEHWGALLNLGENTLFYGEEKISLSKNEFKILLVLMQNKGTVVSREKLMEQLWQTESFVDENTLSVKVNRLRKWLDAATPFACCLLRTARFFTKFTAANVPRAVLPNGSPHP